MSSTEVNFVEGQYIFTMGKFHSIGHVQILKSTHVFVHMYIHMCTCVCTYMCYTFQSAVILGRSTNLFPNPIKFHGYYVSM